MTLKALTVRAIFLQCPYVSGCSNQPAFPVRLLSKYAPLSLRSQQQGRCGMASSSLDLPSQAVFRKLRPTMSEGRPKDSANNALDQR